MTREERLALIEKNKKEIAETRAEMAANRAAREQRGEFFDLPQRQSIVDEPPPSALLEASRRRYIERVAREQQTAILPPEAQTHWDAWADARIKSRVDAAVDAIVDATIKYVGEQDQQVIAELKKLRAEMHALYERDRTELLSLVDDSCMSSRKRNVFQ